MPPPAELVHSLVQGPSLVSSVSWHDEVDSTNRVALDAARRGEPHGLLVLADVQTAGRGRLGRSWLAPPGTSLLLSLLLRPTVPAESWALLTLLGGLALAETVARHLPAADVTLKWPNDLLVEGRKAAGILAEATDDSVVLGVGVDVDWRSAPRPQELTAPMTSLAEETDGNVDRWRVLAGFIGVFTRLYGESTVEPTGFLPAYRRRCATLGMQVRIEQPGGALVGTAVDISDAGHLIVESEWETVDVAAGDVHHVRH